MLKICPRCGEEYVAAVATCVDCGVPLGHEAPPPEAPGLAIAPDEPVVALRHAEVSWVEGLARALSEAGIPSRIELPTEADDRRVQGRGLGAVRCTLYVREADAGAAARVDAAFARTQVPDLPEEDAAWGESDGCPGCGSPLAGDADACPECGLAFGGG